MDTPDYKENVTVTAKDPLNWKLYLIIGVGAFAAWYFFIRKG